MTYAARVAKMLDTIEPVARHQVTTWAAVLLDLAAGNMAPFEALLSDPGVAKLRSAVDEARKLRARLGPERVWADAGDPALADQGARVARLLDSAVVLGEGLLTVRANVDLARAPAPGGVQ